MSSESIAPNQVLSTILKHDRKTSSYKIALLRSINDVVLAYPYMDSFGTDIAIPLRELAHHWMGYYWPFVDEDAPIYQGQIAKDSSGYIRNDIAFRPELTALRSQWGQVIGESVRPADGLFLSKELRLPRKLTSYSTKFQETYQKAIKVIAKAIEMPVRYAGNGQWTVFPKPIRLGLDDSQPITAVPGAKKGDKCVVVESRLWQTFRQLSLWIEALCIHEWSLYSERIKQCSNTDRGTIYRLITDRPDNRRPLTWERNQIEILMMEGTVFTCPWTARPIRYDVPFDLDHIIPLSVYPVNELWNLVPSWPDFNQHKKRDRIPSPERLDQALPQLSVVYDNYQLSTALNQALHEDVEVRFLIDSSTGKHYSDAVAESVVGLIGQIADARNIARF